MKIFINDYDKESLEKAESLLFSGNGQLGLRANLEEHYYNHFATNRETYINGFFDTKDVQYPEKMRGFTPTGESMISVIDGQTTLIKIGNEDLRIDQGEITQSERYLDMTKGITVRSFVWTSPLKKQTKITISRLVSFIHKNLFIHKFDFERLNHQEEIKLETHLNFSPVRTIDKDDPRMSHDSSTSIEVTQIDLENEICQFQAKHSLLKGQLKWQLNHDYESAIENDRITLSSQLDESLTYTKTLSYLKTDETNSHKGLDLNFDDLLKLQEEYLADFWTNSKIQITGDIDLEESVNYSSYALLQSLGTDGQTSIAAKGLSGNGYEGHYFWDTEMFIFPVFLHLQPELAKNLLQFRINTLEKARENRRLFGYQTGALYPWRTISGTESSAFFEAGSAQHHLNADIAYAFISYYEHTGDLELIINGGLEVLIESARIFLEIGYERNNSFHIDKITGPDEYTVLVNDNYYTNRMVAHQFEWIVKLTEILAKNSPDALKVIQENLHFSSEELEKMDKYSKMMALPFSDELGIVAQDRDFLNKSPWPFSKEETKYPILFNYHPLVIYRHQISKQADAVLALMLFQSDFDKATIEKTVAYYDEITTHDSSLSYSTFSIVYSRLGDLDKAYKYFLENARIDLDNSHHNTKDGIHTASMGGTFMAILYGFCNLSIKDDQLHLEPHLPKQIKEIHLPLQFKNEKYMIHVNQDDWSIEKV